MNMILAFPTWLACATCMGDPDDPNVMAASWAILFMLGVLGAVLGMFVMMVRKMVASARNCDATCAPWDQMHSAAVTEAPVATVSGQRPFHPLVPAVARPVTKPRHLESVR